MAAARPGSQQRVYKVVLLGEGKVGKTSLLLRFTQDSFNEAHNQTVQACFTNKRLTIDGTSITLSIWVFHFCCPIISCILFCSFISLI